MYRCIAATIAASLFAPLAHANDALEAKVRAYVPIVSLAKVCDIRINDDTSGDHRGMLEAVKSDSNANKLAYRVHYETQTAYIKARDGGQRAAFCKDFIAANSQYAKARFTAVVEDRMGGVSNNVQKAIAHNVCGAPPVKLSKADWKPYAQLRKMLQNQKAGQRKCRDERLERHGGNGGGHGTVLRSGKNQMSITAANRRSPATTKLGSSRATFYGWHGSTKTPATAHQHKLKYPVSRAAFIRQIKKRRVIRLGFKLAPLKRLSTLWLSKRYSACE